MIRDITLGQYYNTDSFLHRLDPRTKIIGTIVYLVTLFLYMNPYVYVFALLFLVLMIRKSNVPFKFMIRGLRGIAFIMIMTALINIFTVPGDTLFMIGSFPVAKQGVRVAVYMIFRLTFLIIGSSLLTLTTPPVRLTDGLERTFAFMKIIKVPVHDMAMMMSIALRFIPILIEETNIIMKAQLSRGADFESGSLIKRVKSLIPVIIPLFIGAFKKANDLADAMDARCYRGGVKRSRMNPLKYRKGDYAAYAMLVLYAAAIISLGIYAKYLPFGNDILGIGAK